MRTILSIEKPDVVILTGDMLTGNNIQYCCKFTEIYIIDNATAYWRKMVQPMVDLNFYWAITFGNHDDLASGVNGTREDLMKVNFCTSLAH